MKKILMLHGINHNMFGKRDPVQYGTVTLADIDQALQTLGTELGVHVESFQTNSEAAMCERIHQAFEAGQDAADDALGQAVALLDFDHRQAAVAAFEVARDVVQEPRRQRSADHDVGIFGRKRRLAAIE